MTPKCKVLPCPDEADWAEMLCIYHEVCWSAYLAGFTDGSGKEVNLRKNILPTTPTSWAHRFTKFLEWAWIQMVGAQAMAAFLQAAEAKYGHKKP